MKKLTPTILMLVLVNDGAGFIARGKSPFDEDRQKGPTACQRSPYSLASAGLEDLCKHRRTQMLSSDGGITGITISHLMADLQTPSSENIFSRRDSKWRHPMCKNSTGNLAANCGQTYMGSPLPGPSEHNATVFWLHGLGDTGQKWSSVTPKMKMGWTRFVFPSAPVRRTILRLRPTAAWFNVKALVPTEEEHVQGIAEAGAYVNDLVAKEIERGIAPGRIALVGFSMGGAAVLTAGLSSSHPLGAVVAIGSWLPRCVSVSSSPPPNSQSPTSSSSVITASPCSKNTPILMCNGDRDMVIPLAWGRSSAQRLVRHRGGEKTRFRVYAGLEHTATEEVLADVAAFLRKHIPQDVKDSEAEEGDAVEEMVGEEGVESEGSQLQDVKSSPDGRNMEVTTTLNRLYTDLDSLVNAGPGVVEQELN